jgi:hypothetical protein
MFYLYDGEGKLEEKGQGERYVPLILAVVSEGQVKVCAIFGKGNELTRNTCVVCVNNNLLLVIVMKQ